MQDLVKYLEKYGYLEYMEYMECLEKNRLSTWGLASTYQVLFSVQHFSVPSREREGLVLLKFRILAPGQNGAFSAPSLVFTVRDIFADFVMACRAKKRSPGSIFALLLEPTHVNQSLFE